MSAIKSFIGLDVHKDSIVVAMADDGKRDVRFFGKIDGSLVALKKAIHKIKSSGREPYFVYEAGPWFTASTSNRWLEGMDVIT